MAVDTPSQGWVILPAVGDPAAVFTAVSAAQTAGDLMVTGQPLWQWDALASQDGKTYSWSMGGTLPDWQGAPLAMVILLEGYNPVGALYHRGATHGCNPALSMPSPDLVIYICPGETSLEIAS
jgi:hypothetical protein